MTLAMPSIAEQIDASADGQYWPPLPADDEVFPVKVVSELKCDGIAQNLTPIYLLTTASWTDVQPCLTRATMSWQTRMWGFQDGLGVQHGKWMYRVLQGQTPEQGWKDLTTEKEWRSLKKRMIAGEGDVQVVLWHVCLLFLQPAAFASTAPPVEGLLATLPSAILAVADRECRKSCTPR